MRAIVNWEVGSFCVAMITVTVVVYTVVVSTVVSVVTIVVIVVATSVIWVIPIIGTPVAIISIRALRCHMVRGATDKTSTWARMWFAVIISAISTASVAPATSTVYATPAVQKGS